MPVVAPIQNQPSVELLKLKTKEGFNVLYDNYAPALYGIICRTVKDAVTAEDILQEVFVKVWKNIGQYNEEKGKIFTWLLSITRNTAIDYLRSRGYKQKSAIQNTNGFEYIENNLYAEAETGRGYMRTFVMKLEPKYRHVIDLVYFWGYTQDEVSQMLNLPLGTVKTRARTGLQILRNQLK